MTTSARSLFPGSPSSAFAEIPESHGGVEASQHQLEMIKIHDMWQGTKEELRESKAKLAEVERRGAGEAQRARRDQEATLHSMKTAMFELKDKLRFTELQLAGAREEGTRLAHNVEELRARLNDAQSTSNNRGEQQRRQEAAIHELQSALQASAAEKAQAEQRLQEEQRRIDAVAATK